MLSCLSHALLYKYKMLNKVVVRLRPLAQRRALSARGDPVPGVRGLGEESAFRGLQGIFPTQGLNPGLPQCRWILYQLSHKGSPSIPGLSPWALLRSPQRSLCRQPVRHSRTA